MAVRRFDGQVILVTGAGRGAGRTEFVAGRAGARIVVTDPGVSHAPDVEVGSIVR